MWSRKKVREEENYHLDEQSNSGEGSGNDSMTMGDGTVNVMMIRNDEGRSGSDDQEGEMMMTTMPPVVRSV